MHLGLSLELVLGLVLRLSLVLLGALIGNRTALVSRRGRLLDLRRSRIARILRTPWLRLLQGACGYSLCAL